MKAFLLLAAIIGGFYWKVLTTQYTWMDHPDMAYQILPWYQFQAVEWHRGHFPLWDPHLWGGQPVLGQVVPGGAYPLNWLMFLLPLKDGHIWPLWLNLQFLLTHLLAAIFAYLLCRDLGRSKAAALLAGAAFSVGGMLGTEGWPQMLNGASWAPLVLLFFLRAFRGDRPLANAGLCGAFLGVSFLSGHHQVPVFLALLMGALWVYGLWRQKGNRSMLAAAAVFAAFLILTSALQTLPAYEYGLRAVRWVGTHNPLFWAQYVPYLVHEKNSLYPLSILGFVLPGVHDRLNGFISLTVFALALTGVAASWRDPMVRLFAAIAAGALLFCWGGFTPFHGVIYLIVPMAEKARSPHMAIYLCQLALMVLAAFGLDALRDTETRESVWSRRVILLLTLAGLLVFAFLTAASSIRPEVSREYERLTMFAVAALGLAAILHGWKRGLLHERSAVALIVLLALFELGTVTGRTYTSREEPLGFLARLSADQDVLNFLRSQPDLARLEIDTDAVPYNIGDWEGLDQFRSYGAGLTTNVAALEHDRLQGGSRAARYFALTYALSTKPLRTSQQEVFQGRSGLKVYRNPEAYPRVWTVHGDKESFQEARLIAREPTQIVVEAEMETTGVVVVSETYFPGWRARIDGQPAKIREVYGALRGVEVQAGRHRVEMKYTPGSAYWGLGLTFAGLMGAAILGLSLIRNSMHQI